MEEREIVFVRPSRRSLLLGMLAVLLVAAFGELLSKEMPTSSLRSAPPFGVVMLFFAGFNFLLMACLSYQRIVIAGSGIRILSVATFFRWRECDVREVTGMRYHHPGFRQIDQLLVLRLQPAPHRSWNQIELVTVQTLGRKCGIDSGLYIEAVTAVTRVQPAFVVENLPWHYNGVLPRAGRQPEPQMDTLPKTVPKRRRKKR